MKADRIILVLVVVIMLASVVGSYFLFLQQDAMSGKKIDAVKLDVDNLSATLKQVDSQLKEFQLKPPGCPMEPMSQTGTWKHVLKPPGTADIRASGESSQA